MNSESFDEINSILNTRKKFEINGRASWSEKRKADHILKCEQKPPKRVRSESYKMKKNESKKLKLKEINRILLAERDFHNSQRMPPSTVVHKDYHDLKPTRKKEVDKDVFEAWLKVIEVRLPRNTNEDHLEIAGEIAKKYFVNHNDHDEEQSIQSNNHQRLITVIKNAITNGKEDNKKTSLENHNIIIQQASLLLDLMTNPSKLRLENLLRGDIKINDALYREINYHRTTIGSGLPVPDEREKSLSGNNLDRKFIKDVAGKISKLKSLIEFIIENCLRTANARTLLSSSYNEVIIPKLLRTYPINNMIDKFWNYEVDKIKLAGNLDLEYKNKNIHEFGSKERNNISLRKDTIKAVIKLLVPNSVVSLAALDVQTELHLRQNMINIKVLADNLQTFLPIDQMQSYLTKKERLNRICDKVEIHLKSRESGLWSGNHFKRNNNYATGPSCHCKFFCFNKKDPSIKEEDANPNFICGHNHSGSCIECEEMIDLHNLIDETFADVETEITNSGNQSTREQIGQLKENKTYYQDRLNHVIGHQFRLINESLAEDEILKKLKDDPEIIYIETDYAMKFLALKFREKMSDFFGKKGIAWNGSKILWYDAASNRYLFYFTNQISDIDTEDGHLSILCLTTLLKHHRASFPRSEHNKFIISSDGAGCFAGEEFMARLPYLYELIDWEADRHYTNESGGAKNVVDASFSIAKGHVRKYVTAMQGKGDVNCADDLVKVLQEVPLPETISYKTVPIISCFNKNPIKTKGITEAKIQSKSYRKFTYVTGTKTPDKILLYNQSGLGGEPDYELTTSSLWPPGTLAKDIIPLGEPSGDNVLAVPKTRNDFKLNQTETLGIKLERSAKEAEEAENQRIKNSKILKKRERFEESNVPSNISNENNVFPCLKLNCVRTFKGRVWQEKHKCQMGKQKFRAASKIITPIDQANLTIKDMALDFFKSMVLNTNIITNQQTCHIIPSENESRFLPGFANRVPLRHPKIPIEIIKCIEFLFKHGEQKNNAKFQPPDVRKYLLKAGLDKFEKIFNEGENLFLTYFDETNGEFPKFFPAIVPEEFRIKNQMQTLNTKLKVKRKEAARPVIPARELKIQYMTSLQSHRGLDGIREDHEKIAEYLINLKNDDGILIHRSKLILKNLKGLPELTNHAWDKSLKSILLDAMHGNLCQDQLNALALALEEEEAEE